MNFDTLIAEEQDGLTRRLARMLGGDLDAAQDVRQEAFARAWQRLPRDLDDDHQRAWLRRTASNLVIDELRRRARRPVGALDDGPELAGSADVAEPDAAREALRTLGAHERFVLLLRFEGGLAHGEIARLLDISDDAARKRVARARAAFVSAYRAVSADAQPLVLLLARDESPAPYVRWLADSGARVRVLREVPTERELALAEAVVLTGAVRDVHSAMYGERPRSLRGDPDLANDRADLAVLRGALALDLPVVGVCRGHQLLNIATGGSLFQDVVADGVAEHSHDASRHGVDTYSGTAIRGLLGRSAEVHSEHHQAVRRLGRHLRVAATSHDGLIETIERTDRRLVLGLQWHPETERRGPGDRIAEALVHATRRAAA
ncbi:MAG: sigma-70 family RNA polymerase sigma factor [Solirubrobacteraceae bacterium]